MGCFSSTPWMVAHPYLCCDLDSSFDVLSKVDPDNPSRGSRLWFLLFPRSTLQVRPVASTSTCLNGMFIYQGCDHYYIPNFCPWLMFKLTYHFPVSIAILFLFALFIPSPLLLKEIFFSPPEEVYQHLVSASILIVGACLPPEGMACLVTQLTGYVSALPLSFV